MIVTPDRFHPRGEAVGPHPAGRPPLVRVFGGIPGEAAQVRVNGAGAHEAHAVWEAAASPAPIRVEPGCPHYEPCGGCPWMHLTADAAREARRQLVLDALTTAGIPTPVEPVRVGPDGDEGYRHVVKLPAHDTRDGVRFGAFGRGTHHVRGIPGCVALAPVLRPFTFLAPLELPAGVVRHLVVRASRTSGRTLATLVVRAESPEVTRAAGAIPADSVAIHVNARPGDGILDPAGVTRVLRGPGVITETVAGVRLAVGPTDFYQTNPGVAERLWAELPALSGPFLDLYAGIGAATLPLARRYGVGPVLGVEESPAAVRRARENAKENRLDVRFLCGRVGEVPLAGFEGATILLDPPRQGMTDAARAQVVALAPPTLVYVSCHPPALARDLAALLRVGFTVESVVPYDMFPHTPHVEVVAVLRRSAS